MQSNPTKKASERCVPSKWAKPSLSSGAIPSRLPLPKSVFNSALTRPQVRAQESRGESSATTSLAKGVRLRPHPYLWATVKPTLRARGETNVGQEVVTRLDFESVKTPQTQSTMSSTTSPTSASMSAIDWTTISKEAQVVALKTSITQLEELLEETKGKISQNEVKYELKIDKLNKENENKDNKCEELEKQIKLLSNKSEQMSIQLNNAREEFGREYQKYEKTINEMNKTIIVLRNQLSDSQASNESVEARHRSQLVSIEDQMQTLRTQLSQCTQEKQVLHKHIQRLESEAKHSQQLDSALNAAKADIQVLNQEIQSYKDGIKLNNILENEFKELKALREEHQHLKQVNQTLSDVHSNNLILKEKILGLESQLKAANNRLESAIETDVNSSVLREQLAEWQQLLASDSPTRVSKHLSQLQNKELELRSQLGSIQTQLNEMNSIRTQLECDLRSKNNQLVEHKKKVEEQNETIRKLNRKCLLFAKEKDSYKRLIASYELDITLDHNRVLEDRVSTLEAIVDEYRVLVEQLETEVKQLKNEDNSEQYKQHISQLENQLDSCKAINSRLEAMHNHSMDSLSIADTCPPLAPLESKREHIDYRVLHLTQNPLKLNIEQQNHEFKRLVDENQRLQTRLELLETGCDADITRQLDEGIKNTQQLQKLQQKLSSAEKRQQNIIEAFKRTSKEFREVCYRLTGFRIDLLKQNTYRLSHIYADSPNDLLLFECDSDRTIKLLENDYSKRLHDTVHTYLTQHDSFPAFLASLTLDLFNKQTIVQ